MKKRLLSICLVLAVLMSLTVPITAGAADVSGDQLQYISGTVQNPLYANVPTPEREDAETQSDEWTEAETEGSYLCHSHASSGSAPSSNGEPPEFSHAIYYNQ